MQFELRILIKNKDYEQKDNKQANNDKEMSSNDRYNTESLKRKQKKRNLFDFIGYNDLENSIKDIVSNTFSDNMKPDNNLNRLHTFHNASENYSMDPVKETLTYKEKSGINKTIIVNRSECRLSNQCNQ